MNRRIIILILAISLVSCNKFSYYQGPPFMYFDLDKSSPYSVSEDATMNATYYVHYTGEQANSANTVTFSIISGNGMKEDVDYILLTKDRKLVFEKGITALPVKIMWLPHKIDIDKDNTLVLELVSVDNPDIVLGMPGPDKKYKRITLSKYN